jgi:hypothetical protein
MKVNKDVPLGKNTESERLKKPVIKFMNRNKNCSTEARNSQGGLLCRPLRYALLSYRRRGFCWLTSS